MSTYAQLRDAIAQTLDIPPDSITQTSVAADVDGWDSMGHVNLMMALEQTFDIQLEVDDFQELTSVPAILDYLKRAGVS